MLIVGITLILVILGATVSPWFMAIAVLMGAFLMQSVLEQLSQLQVLSLKTSWDKMNKVAGIPEPLSEEDDPAIDPELDDMETPLPATQSFSKFLKSFSPKL